jgi:hypothetical protein
MRLSIFFIIVLLIGCKPDSQNRVAVEWFDLPGLVDELVLNMDNKNHRAIKTFTLNRDVETKQYESSDSTFWARELAKLSGIDLNSSQIRDALQMKGNIKDYKSNLLIDQYLLPDDNMATLKKLNVYYLEDTSEIRQIYAELNSDNLISKSNTKINLWINRYSNILLIDSLQIVGCDKTFMQSEREYHSTTRITW